MANLLEMAQVQAIQVLRKRGWSRRRVARELGIHRETAARYFRLAQAFENRPDPPAGSGSQNRPNPPTGSDLPNRADPPAGSGPGSSCEPFRELILAALTQGLSAQRIWQDLRGENGFPAGYDSVKRFVRRLRGDPRQPFRRLECAPGAEAQVDFGTGAPVIVPDDPAAGGSVTAKTRRRKTHVFRIVLSHSRKAYSEAIYRQTTEDFIR